MARTSCTSRMTVCSASLAAAAWAAVVTQPRISSSVALLSVEVSPDHDRHVDDIEGPTAQHELSRPEGLAHLRRQLLTGAVVEHDLGLSVGEAVRVSAQGDLGAGGDEALGCLQCDTDGTRPVEHLHA